MQDATEEKTVVAHSGVVPVRRMVHLAFVALIDAVPFVGVLYLGWSVSACLIVFWCENLMSGAMMVLRMLVHQALTHDRHYGEQAGMLKVGSGRGPARELKAPLTAAFAFATFVFTAVHGLFVFFLVYLLGGLPSSEPAQWGMDSAQLSLLKGIGMMAVFQVLDVLHDFLGIRHWPFVWIKTLADRQLNRVVVLHLGIIFGGFAIVLLQVQSVTPILLVALGIKLLADLAAERRSP